MTENRRTGYGSGQAAIPLAPVPFPTNKTLGTTDYTYNFGQLAYEVPNTRWVLYSGDGLWIPVVAGSGNVGYLAGNSGGNVPPNSGGVINVVGDGTTISIVGNPSTHTLTASLVGGLEAIEEFIPDSGTSPVVPNSSGQVTMTGTGGVLTTVGGTNTLTFNVPAGGGLSLAAFGSTPNADGLTLTTGVLNMQPADGTHPGGVSTTSQTFGGAKNFAVSASSPIFAVLSGGGGTAQIEYPSSAANYNFNLPATAGTSGYFLTSAGGGSSPMTWTQSSILANSFVTDSGTVTPSSGVVDILGQATPSVTGIKFTGSGNVITGTMFSPFKGNFNFTQSTAGTSETLEVSHSDNSNTGSHAILQASVGGTSGGDAFALFNVGSSLSYAFGIDNATSGGPLCLNYAASGSTTPGVSGSIMLYNPTYNNWSFGAGNTSNNTAAIEIARNQTTQGGGIACNNTNATSTADCVIGVTTANGGGVPYFITGVNGVQVYTFGIDQNDANQFKIRYGGTTFGTGSTAFQISSSGAVQISNAYTLPTTAGTANYVLTTNGSSAASWQPAGTGGLTITSVAHAASPYTVLAADEFIAVDCSGGVVTIKLPNAPSTGREIYIKDSKGNAGTNNISVTTVGGTVTIDGQTTYTMSTNYQSISVVFDGSNYEVF